MKWNYRIIRRTFGSNELYQIHEVYYDDDGCIKSWTENPIIPTGETPEELEQDFSKQLLAFGSPILNYDVLIRECGEKR